METTDPVSVSCKIVGSGLEKRNPERLLLVRRRTLLTSIENLSSERRAMSGRRRTDRRGRLPRRRARREDSERMVQDNRFHFLVLQRAVGGSSPFKRRYIASAP